MPYPLDIPDISLHPALNPPSQHPRASELVSPNSDYTIATTSSGNSLLAKRLGSDRAANMVLPTTNRTSTQDRWHRRDLLSPDHIVTPGRPNDLPATPTWMPRLTPTRRGEELFLNVQ
jgi:hypothetical protein